MEGIKGIILSKIFQETYYFVIKLANKRLKKIIKICRYPTESWLFSCFNTLPYFISLFTKPSPLSPSNLQYCFCAPNYLFSLYIHRITAAAESPEATCSSRDILSVNASIIQEFVPTTRLSVFVHVMQALAPRSLDILLATEVTQIQTDV